MTVRTRVPQWARQLDYLTTHISLSPIRRGFAPGFENYKKRCTRLAAASDKAYQLLAHGWWFSPGTPASSTTKTDRHDIAEILLKVAVKHQNSKSNLSTCIFIDGISNKTLQIKKIVKHKTNKQINKQNTVWFGFCNYIPQTQFYYH